MKDTPSDIDIRIARIRAKVAYLESLGFSVIDRNKTSDKLLPGMWVKHRTDAIGMIPEEFDSGTFTPLLTLDGDKQASWTPGYCRVASHWEIREHIQKLRELKKL